MSYHQLTAQLGFDDFLAESQAANRVRKLERATAHLPSTMEDALPFYRGLLRDHDAAMREADTDKVFALREEAHNLARRLNNFEPGILANDHAPACVLERLTSERCGVVPLFGQTGEFDIEVSGARVRIALDGMFGIGNSVRFWPGFSVNAIETDKPFVSETGYRSFLGINPSPQKGMTPETFAITVLERYIENELCGVLVAIEDPYRG